MLGTNFFRAYHQIKQKRYFFCIHLIGLCACLLCGVYTYNWMTDKFCNQGLSKIESQLYQITRSAKNGGEVSLALSTPGLLAESLASQFSEVEYAVTVEPGLNDSSNNGVVSLEGGDNGIVVAPHYVSHNFFDVFPYDLLQNAVIFEKKSVFISEKLALKLFNTTDDVLGKSVMWNDEKLSELYTVSGVFFPSASSPSAPVDLLFSYENYREQNELILNWNNYTSSTFVVLNEGTDVAQLSHQISNYIRSKNKLMESDFFIMPYSDKGYELTQSQEYIKDILAIALCIMIIVCINFINLSMIKSFMKEREADIKKIFESRRQLVFQHLGELVFVTFISLPVAVLIGWALSPVLNSFMTHGFNLNLDTIFMVSALSVALFMVFSMLLNERRQYIERNTGSERPFKSNLTKLEM